MAENEGPLFELGILIKENISAIPKAIANAWNDDTSAIGTPEEAQAAVEEIRAVTIGGYTLYVFTASNAAWTVPPELANATEAWAGAIGGSSRGPMGPTQENVELIEVLGGKGGLSGGYIVNPFDPSAIGSALNITVGVAASSVNSSGTQTSIYDGANELVLSIPGVDGIATPQGDLRARSAPGNGGDGGSAVGPQDIPTAIAYAGNSGESTTAATGGSGGSPSFGNGTGTAGNGSNGSVGRTDAIPIRGGSGGGGGGGCSRYGGSATGGNGGNGAFPGGGPGGGGAAVSNGTIYNQTGGTPGLATNGVGWILCR